MEYSIFHVLFKCANLFYKICKIHISKCNLHKKLSSRTSTLLLATQLPIFTKKLHSCKLLYMSKFTVRSQRINSNCVFTQNLEKKKKRKYYVCILLIIIISSGTK